MRTRLRHLLWEVHRRLCKHTTVNTRQGRYTISFDEFIGKSLYINGEYELAFMQNMVAFLGKRPGTLIDVGANIGTTSIGLIRLGGAEQSIAIEPESHNYHLLRRNVAQNRMANRIRCLNYAASNQTGIVDLELHPTNYGDHRIRVTTDDGKMNEASRQTVQVITEPLDELLLPQEWALLWMDVQGHEGQVLEGADRVLSTGLPVVSEICPYRMERASYTAERFCRIASTYWQNFYVWRRHKFMQYPIDMLGMFFDEVGYDGHHDNVVFIPGVGI